VLRWRNAPPFDKPTIDNDRSCDLPAFAPVAIHLRGRNFLFGTKTKDIQADVKRNKSLGGICND
jgi:hypothetical protein